LIRTVPGLASLSQRSSEWPVGTRIGSALDPRAADASDRRQVRSGRRTRIATASEVLAIGQPKNAKVRVVAPFPIRPRARATGSNLTPHDSCLAKPR
jgi:hypothetical protein